MVIEKFLHSCLRVTEGEHRLLIDPGSFCFMEGRVKPEELGLVDAVLLTHDHSDHFDPDALRVIVAAGMPTILAHPPLAEKVRAAGFPCEDIASGMTREVGGFTVEAMETPHEPLPFPVPPHCGYLINRWLYHPGDSLVFPKDRSIEILALPIAGPWCTLLGAVEAAKALRPKHVIPIHDAIIQPFFLNRLQMLTGEAFAGTGIVFHPGTFGRVFDGKRSAV